MVMPTPIISERDLRRLKSLPIGEQLEAELERAVVVPSDEIPEDVVTIGSRVVFVDETTGKQRYVRLVDPMHADLAQLEVSVLAPVGAALIGLPVGGVIDWQFPDGKIRRLRVKELIYQPESGRSYQPRRK
jgi:regulator of nucleoside diphosphate kinase